MKRIIGASFKPKALPFLERLCKLGRFWVKLLPKNAERLKELGKLYGEMVQIHDDLNDALAIPANPDWIQERLPLPILFAQTVEHAERARFLELRRQIMDESALLEAQDILIRCGAVSYCVDQILRRHQAAQEIVAALSLPKREMLDALIEEVVEPVWKLFDAIGLFPHPIPIPLGQADPA